MPENILVCALRSGKISKWDLNTFTKIKSFKAHTSHISFIMRLNSSQILSASDDRTVKLWNHETDECVRTFQGHLDDVLCIEISRDQSKMYTASWDHTIRVWDISSGECLKVIKLDAKAYCLKLISTNLIAVGVAGQRENLKIVDLTLNQIVRSLDTEFRTVFSLGFNPEENVLLCGIRDGSILMWQF